MADAPSPDLELVTVPCRTDNYAFLLHTPQTGETALIDAPAAAPIVDELERRGWHLTDILITHHHNDHIDGVGELRASGARVIGAAADAHRLPPLDLSVKDGDSLIVCGAETQVMDASGHTLGHIAYYIPAAGAVFTGDSLMALGCGRLFEGDAPTMWRTLTRLSELPPETSVCSGHEYTAANGRFALTVDGTNPALIARMEAVEEARRQGHPTVPSSLGEELETNPFLRARSPEVKAALGMQGADDAAVFAEIRRRKDAF